MRPADGDEEQRPGLCGDDSLKLRREVGSHAKLIECHFGPLRTFPLNNSDRRSHEEQERAIQSYLAWRKPPPQAQLSSTASAKPCSPKRR